MKLPRKRDVVRRASRRVDKMLLGALVSGALLLGILAGVVAMRDEPAADAEGACPEGSSVAPDGKCATDAEACYTYLDGVASTTVRCTAESRDGSGFVQWSIGGTGGVTVRVRDGAGNTIYERAERMMGEIGDLDAVSGARGTWTIETTFSDARGGGRVTLWG